MTQRFIINVTPLELDAGDEYTDSDLGDLSFDLEIPDDTSVMTVLLNALMAGFKVTKGEDIKASGWTT